MATQQALAARTERLDPEIATHAYQKEERGGKVFVDSTRAGQGTHRGRVQPAGPPRVAGLGAGGLESLDDVRPRDITVRTARERLGDGGDAWTESLPEPQQLPADLIAEATPSRLPVSWPCTRASDGRRRSATRPATDDRPLRSLPHDEQRLPVGTPMAGTEVEHLVSALDRLRTTFEWKSDGLILAGLQTRIGASALTLKLTCSSTAFAWGTTSFALSATERQGQCAVGLHRVGQRGLALHVHDGRHPRAALRALGGRGRQVAGEGSGRRLPTVASTSSATSPLLTGTMPACAGSSAT